jgi:uncharacterized phosphatase
MTRIALVRHGETDWNRIRRIQGRSDVPLNETGRAQARRTASALLAERWDAVYSSPLSRASETAGIIAETLGLQPAIAVEALTERNYGEAEGLTGIELDAKFPGATVVPGRERRSDAAARAIPALIELARRHLAGRILVVSHGGLIRSVLMHLEPGAGDHHTEPIVNGSVHSLDYSEGALSLVGFNEELVVPGESDDDITEQNAVEGRESSRD